MSGLAQIRALFDYNEWANGNILDAAARAGEEALARKLGASFDSVQGNLLHTLSAQEIWSARWTGEQAADAPGLEPGKVVDRLRSAFDDSHRRVRRYLASLGEEDLQRPLAYTDTRGVKHERILWQLLLHVANHGTHHRAESAMLLTSLGTPPRQLDYVFFEIERAGGAPRLT